MIKIFLYIINAFPITTNAISLQELRDNPTKIQIHLCR